MACVAIDSLLSKEEGRFGGDIYKLAFPRSFWIGMRKVDTFPAGIGDTIRNLTQERAAPTTYNPWSSVTFEDGKEGGSCLPPVEIITAGETIRNYNLQQAALESTDFCVNDLRGAWELEKRISNHVDQLTNFSIQFLEFRERHEYLRMTGTKVVVGGAGIDSEGTGETFNNITPNCAGGNLTQGILDHYRILKIRDGATGMGLENGSPILTLVTDMETSTAIIRESPTQINELLWGKPSELLAPYGVTRTYKGFYHLLDMFPIRYTCSAGAYTEVFPFINQAASKGTKSVLNPDWLTAPYTTSHIYEQSVKTTRVPAPITSAGGGTKFNAVNYLGEWKWQNYYDRKCNPDMNIGHFRGVFMEGTESVHPERGVSFVHLRCEPARGPTGCPTGS